MPSMLCTVCQDLVDTVSNLTQDIEDLDELYADALGEGDPNKARIILAEIQEKFKERHAASHSLIQCVEHNHLMPLDATFACTGTATTTIPQLPGPFSFPGLSIGFHFDAVRSSVTITSFTPPVTIPYDSDTLTVSLPSSDVGTFSCEDGAMSIPVVWLFHFSRTPLPTDNPNSTVSMALNTGPNTCNGLTANGSKMDDLGNITLAGCGVFSGGVIPEYLGHQAIAITLMGTVSPLP